MTVTPGADSLLEALVYLSAQFGHARSAETLVAGLPISPAGLTPALFCQAAARAGFKARIVERAIAQIPAEALPVIAILTTRQAVIIESIKDDSGLQVIDPASGDKKTIRADELSGQYAGYAIYIKPDASPREEKKSLAAHWFWGSIIENRHIYAKVLTASLLINCFALTGPIFIMNFYNRVLPNDAIETGWVLGIGAASIFVFDFIIKTLRGYFIDIAGRRADVIVAQKLYDQVLDMRMGQRRGMTGVFANNLREFDALREFFNAATMTGLVDFPFSLLFIAVIWIIAGGKVAFLLLALYALVLAVGYLMQIPVQHKVHHALKTAEKKHGMLIETLGNMETIRGVGGEGPLRAQYSRYTGQAALAGQESRFYSGLSVNFSAFIQQLSGVLIVLMGMHMIRGGEMTVGALIAAVLLSSRAIAPIGMIASLVNKYHQSRAAYRNLDEIMRLHIERPLDKNFLHRPSLRGSFVFKDVDFSYDPSSARALEKINLEIRAGEKIAIVGRIGSGKSTLVKLLVNFYEPSGGTILVDGTDLRQIDPADLRRHVSYMGQNGSLMSGTVRSNIAMGRPKADDAAVLKAAEMAGVHDFIRRHPLGYDAPVGERGEGLSDGQRQTIALARTLLMDADTVIMDEPTNSMDSGTEEKILRNLEKSLDGKTVIFVTHKPALLRLVTRLVVMDNGKIVMDGPRDAVLQAIAAGKVAAVT